MERRDFLAGTAATVAAIGTLADSNDARAQSTSGGSAGSAGAITAGAITDVAGVKVGHFTDTRRPTGCTVIITEEGATGGVDVRGSAPGTRETDLLNPTNLVDKVHAIVLAGGSAFGLEAATGVVRYLEERKIGTGRRDPIAVERVQQELAFNCAHVGRGEVDEVAHWSEGAFLRLVRACEMWCRGMAFG